MQFPFISLTLFFFLFFISISSKEEGQGISNENKNEEENKNEGEIRNKRKEIVKDLILQSRNHDITKSLIYLDEDIIIKHFFSNTSGKTNVKEYLEMNEFPNMSWVQHTFTENDSVLTLVTNFGGTIGLTKRTIFTFNKENKIISISGW